jgi:hypothetical protein
LELFPYAFSPHPALFYMLIAVTGHPPAGLACGVDDAATYRSQAAREIPGYSKEDGVRTQPDD